MGKVNLQIKYLILRKQVKLRDNYSKKKDSKK